MRLPLALLLLLAVAASPCLHADNPAALKERLHKAEAESSLDALGMKPWHLLARFQLLDAKGQPGDAGTIEEWWASPTLYKIAYTSTSYTNTEIINQDGHFKTSANLYTPETLANLREQITHPLPASKDIDESTPYMEQKDIGKLPMDCIMLAHPIKNTPYPPLGLFPTFCLDRGKNSLRVSIDIGTGFIVRNKMGLFLSRTVAIDQSILFNEVVSAKAHIERLSTLPEPVAVELFVPASEMTQITSEGVPVGTAIMAGSVLSKVPPIYPERAKQQHVSGSVVLAAQVGTDGRIHSLKLVSAFDADLALAAIAAVRQWTYKPYLLNGQAVSVETTITVNFSFGGG